MSAIEKLSLCFIETDKLFAALATDIMVMAILKRVIRVSVKLYKSSLKFLKDNSYKRIYNDDDLN